MHGCQEEEGWWGGGAGEGVGGGRVRAEKKWQARRMGKHAEGGEGVVMRAVRGGSKWGKGRVVGWGQGKGLVWGLGWEG